MNDRGIILPGSVPDLRAAAAPPLFPFGIGLALRPGAAVHNVIIHPSGEIDLDPADIEADLAGAKQPPQNDPMGFPNVMMQVIAALALATVKQKQRLDSLEAEVAKFRETAERLVEILEAARTP